jgi:hypothetical protein
MRGGKAVSPCVWATPGSHMCCWGCCWGSFWFYPVSLGTGRKAVVALGHCPRILHYCLESLGPGPVPAESSLTADRVLQRTAAATHYCPVHSTTGAIQNQTPGCPSTESAGQAAQGQAAGLRADQPHRAGGGQISSGQGLGWLHCCFGRRGRHQPGERAKVTDCLWRAACSGGLPLEHSPAALLGCFRHVRHMPSTAGLAPVSLALTGHDCCITEAAIHLFLHLHCFLFVFLFFNNEIRFRLNVCCRCCLPACLRGRRTRRWSTPPRCLPARMPTMARAGGCRSHKCSTY